MGQVWDRHGSDTCPSVSPTPVRATACHLPFLDSFYDFPPLTPVYIYFLYRCRPIITTTTTIFIFILILTLYIKLSLTVKEEKISYTGYRIAAGTVIFLVCPRHWRLPLLDSVGILINLGTGK